MTRPTVTIAIPVLNEEAFIDECLASVCAQSYENIIEVLVVDGGSGDRTREFAARWPLVSVLDNPRRIQAAALNIALAAARGEVVVRVDGHCRIAPDYVDRCVDALQRTRAAMVGGAMTPVASSRASRGIAKAMTSRLGAGPARFHVGGQAAFVDTVYLGAYRTVDARDVGGYAEDVGVNEDAEFAIRMQPRGGVFFDPSISSTYAPRSSTRALARQFYRYGRSRAVTALRHPSSVAPRQLVAPLLVLGLVSPARRPVAALYAMIIGSRVALEIRNDPAAAPGLAAALPTMHLAWGVGFLIRLSEELVTGLRRTFR